MDKWEAIFCISIVLGITVYNVFETWQKKEAEKVCYQAVASGRGDIKDCKK